MLPRRSTFFEIGLLNPDLSLGDHTALDVRLINYNQNPTHTVMVNNENILDGYTSFGVMKYKSTSHGPHGASTQKLGKVVHRNSCNLNILLLVFQCHAEHEPKAIQVMPAPLSRPSPVCYFNPVTFPWHCQSDGIILELLTLTDKLLPIVPMHSWECLPHLMHERFATPRTRSAGTDILAIAAVQTRLYILNHDSLKSSSLINHSHSPADNNHDFKRFHNHAGAKA